MSEPHDNVLTSDDFKALMGSLLFKAEAEADLAPTVSQKAKDEAALLEGGYNG